MTLDQMMREEQIYWHRQGVEEGIVKGIEKGIEQGIEQGIVKGIEQGKLESAKEFILQGSTYEFVSQVLGISEDKIREYVEECGKVSLSSE